MVERVLANEKKIVTLEIIMPWSEKGSFKETLSSP